jgi:hypothetical protein
MRDPRSTCTRLSTCAAADESCHAGAVTQGWLNLDVALDDNRFRLTILYQRPESTLACQPSARSQLFLQDYTRSPI